MTAWLFIALPLWLGQTPEASPALTPPAAEERDTAPRDEGARGTAPRDDEDARERLGGPEVDPPQATDAPATADVPSRPGDTFPLTEPGLPEAEGPEVGIGGAGTPPELDVGAEPPATVEEELRPGGERPVGEEGPLGEQIEEELRPGPEGVPGAEAERTLRRPQDVGRELQRLRAQVQALQRQLEQGEQRASATAERAQATQQQLAALQQRAQRVEQLRQQRLVLLDRAAEWLLAAQQQLVVGELDVGTSLRLADQALGNAVQNAAQTGSTVTVGLLETARDRLALALELVDERDVFRARALLDAASDELRQARLRTLSAPDPSLATP